MTATADLTVPHSINPIFQYIFDCLGFNPINDNFDFVFQITAPRRPIDIRISADYSIFVNGAPKIDCYVGCVASDPALLKPNVVHVILFNFWKQKFVEHRTITLAIDRNGSSLLISFQHLFLCLTLYVLCIHSSLFLLI